MQFDLFSTDFSGEHFEAYSHENGFTYWYASNLMNMLGYKNWQSFQKAINKAMTTCNTLSIPIMENFTQEYKIEAGKSIPDFRLSRFACYLVVMNADNKMPLVAKAQAYFASLAGAVQDYLEEISQIERLVIRDEITEREQSLAGVAKVAGVETYQYFQNAGYRGMYNKNISQLKAMRNIPKTRSLLDFMGKEELAANLFRITQTELKIKQDDIQGQAKLEAAAEKVGKQVRQSMIDISGIPPEALSTEKDIKTVKNNLKSKNKEIKKIDKLPKKK
jgi:DNA-damage-inducible protein D